MAHLGELLAELRQCHLVQYPITKTVDIFLIWTN